MERRDCGKRHHLPVFVAHIELPDIFRSCSVFAFSFDVDLPLAAKLIEVVHKQPPHERLDRSVDVADGDSLFENFVFVDIDELLRHARQKGRAQARDLGSFARSLDEGVQIRCQERHVLTRPVFENKSESAGRADSGNRRRREIESDAFRKLAKFPVETLLDCLKLFLPRLSVTPFLQGYEEERVVGGTDKTEETESNNGGGVFNAWSLSQNLFDFPRHLVRALQRRRVGELEIDVKVSLIFVRQEARRHLIAKESCGYTEGYQHDQRDGALA